MQAIIGRQEQLIASIRGVCYALLTAFAGGLIAGKVPVSAWLFFAVGCGVTASFLWMELAQRVGLKRAVERSRVVERALRGDATYRGPSLADELTRPVRAQEMYSKLFQNEMIYVPALAVIVVIAVLAIVIHFRTI